MKTSLPDCLFLQPHLLRTTSHRRCPQPISTGAAPDVPSPDTSPITYGPLPYAQWVSQLTPHGPKQINQTDCNTSGHTQWHAFLVDGSEVNVHQLLKKSSSWTTPQSQRCSRTALWNLILLTGSKEKCLYPQWISVFYYNFLHLSRWCFYTCSC